MGACKPVKYPTIVNEITTKQIIVTMCLLLVSVIDFSS